LNKFFFHCTLFFSFFVFSQNNEIELWGKMNFKDKINKNLFFSLEPGSRYNLDNFFFTKQFLDISLEHYIYKGHLGELSFEIGGRLTKMPNQRRLGKRQYLTTYYSKKIQKFNISWRSRLFFEQNIMNYNRQYFRNKYTLQYNKYDFFRPFIDGEYLYGLNSENVNKFRYSLGSSFRFSKKTTIKIFYRLQNSEETIQKKKTIFGVYLTQKL
tara:strand:- start:882 stop:1517 length:636 start_codon:yes stop_codon:yes gene_type:complete